MKRNTLLTYVLASTIVVILGALLGWYFFLRGQTEATTGADVARGFNASAPFGVPAGSTYGNITSDARANTNATSSPHHTLPQLWHVDTTPVAGFAFTGNASSSELSFVLRGTGYVFSGDIITQTVTRRTNTLLPRIDEALFSNGGGVIERATDAIGNITTFIGRIATSNAGTTGTTTVRALVGAYMDNNIYALALNPATEELFYLMSGVPTVEGFRSQWAGAKKKSIFSSAIADWKLMWLSNGRLLLLTKPADGVPGYAYSMQSDGSLRALVRAIPGLTIAPRPSGEALLWGLSTGGSISLYARVSDEAASVMLPVKTVADKCAWAPGKELVVYCAVPRVTPSGNFLNDWYKGVVHTTDSLWRIDIPTNRAELLYTPDSRLSLDIESPTIDASGAFMAFRNARDASLWVVRLTP